MAAAPTTRHQRIVQNLAVLLFNCRDALEARYSVVDGDEEIGYLAGRDRHCVLLHA